MNKIKRTTITVGPEWTEGVKKAQGMEIPMSQVVKALVKAWVEGDVDVRIEVVQVDGVEADEELGDEPECCAGQCVGDADCCVEEG